MTFEDEVEQIKGLVSVADGFREWRSERSRKLPQLSLPPHPAH